MYGVVNIIKYPDFEDPKMLSLELFPTFDEAANRTKAIIETFIEEYGEDYIQTATKEEPIAIMSNGEVVEYAYIVEVKE